MKRSGFLKVGITLGCILILAAVWIQQQPSRESQPHSAADVSHGSPTVAGGGTAATAAAVAPHGDLEPVAKPVAADRYAAAKVLDERRTESPKIRGRILRQRLIATDFKYPLVRVEDALEAVDGAWQTIEQVAAVADHVVVKLRPGVTEQQVLARLDHLHAVVRKRMPASGILLISFPDATLDTVPEAVAEISRMDDLAAYAEPDYLVHASVVPDDSSFSSLWAMHNTGQSGGTADADIDAPEAWDLHTGSNTVRVAVIDSGVDYTHPDLAANIWANPGEIASNGIDDDANGYIDDTRGWNFVANTNNPMDDNRHGTHCAGTIGSLGNNGAGVAGVCWQVSILPLKFLDSTGAGANSDATEAIAYATAKQVWLSSNSWGGSGYSQAMKDVIDDANAAGILFVAAAGNDTANNDSTPSYPANYVCPNVISVASTTRTDAISSFSNFGATKVHLGAPGSNIYSTTPGNTYATLSGTSMAAPHVAGACALVKAAKPTISHADAKNAILAAVDPLPALNGKTSSGGRLNVFNALLLAGDIAINPTTQLVATGPVGGPFTPTSVTFTLTNHGSAAAAWTVGGTPAWLTLSTSGGVLGADESTTLLASLNPAANGLAAGIFNGNLTFTNTTTGRSQLRTLSLRVGQPDYFTELFDSSPNDTANQTFTFTPNGSVSYYSAHRATAVGFPTNPSGGTTLTLGDDTFATVTLTGGTQVSLYGTSYSSFHVGSNGYVTFGSGDSGFSVSLANHFAKPRIAGLFDDLNPGSGGTVSWKQLADRAAVTFQNVREYGTTATNSFQMELFFDGRIHLTLLNLGSAGGLVGLSQGLGQPADFTESDFTAFPPLVPLVPGAEIAVEQPIGTDLVDGSATVNFGPVAVASGVNLTGVVRNGGLDPLTGISASIAGADAGDFTILSAIPATLASGNAFVFSVRFTPTALGSRTASLILTSSDSDENPFDVTLTGAGVLPSPEIAIEQPAGTGLTHGVSTVDFGTVAIARDTPLTFTVRNSGSSNLTGLGVTFAGSHAGDFSVITLPVAPVVPAGSTTFVVRFAPGDSGTRSAVMSMASNDGDENPFEVTLTGAGFQPLSALADDFDPDTNPSMWQQFGGSPAANTYGQGAGAGSTGNSLWFGGGGNRFATTHYANTSAGGGVSFLLALANSSSSNWEMADAGEDVVLEYSNDGKVFVQFGGPYNNVTWQRIVVAIPAAARTVATQFRFRQRSNSGSGYDHWAIDDVNIGLAVPLLPEIAVEQPAGTNLPDGGTKSFGAVATGAAATLSFTIRNTGALDLSGLGVVVDGANPEDFVVTAPPAASVAPGGTTTFSVRFSPSALGTRNAALHLASNDADENPFDISLSGTGVIPLPEIAVEQPIGTNLLDGGTKNFGNVTTGGSASLSFTVRNVGTAGLTDLGIVIDGPQAAAFTVTTPPSAAVLPGGSTTFVVRFAPAMSGNSTASLHLASNDADENPFDVSLAGSSVTLAEALDNALNWTTGGTASWQPQTATTHDGVDAAKSGTISHSQESWMQTTVAGPGRLSFWWKVSSELDYDYLRFTIDGAELTAEPAISGTVDWQQKINLPVAAGSHVLRWSYSKDGSISSGSDAGWVDQVSYVMDVPAPEIMVEQPGGAGLVDGRGVVAFASPAVGVGSSKTFTIRNAGSLNLTGLAIVASGTHSAEFAVGALGATTLVPGASTTFSVTFTPGESGDRNAALQVASNDPDENPFDIALSGQVSAEVEFPSVGGITIPSSGNATPYPSTIAVSGITGAVTNLRVKLNGLTHTWPDDIDAFLVSPSGRVCALISDAGGSYSISGINLVLADSAPSLMTDSGPLVSGTYMPTNYQATEALPPGGIGTIGTSLMALAAGTINGNWKLYVTDDVSGDSGTLASWSLLIESRIEADIVIEQPLGTEIPDGGAAEFGTVWLGSETSLTFTIRNTGNAHLAGLAVGCDGANAADFTVTSPPAAAVPPGGSTQLEVTFFPSGDGLRTAAIHLYSNDPDENPFDLALTGRGRELPPPEIEVAQSSGAAVFDGDLVDLGDLPIPTWGKSKAWTFTISNTGGRSLLLGAIICSGSEAAQFSLSGPVQSAVPSGGSTTFAVTFTPSPYGSRSRVACLHLASNDGDEPSFAINLFAEVFPLPEIEVTHPSGSDLTDGTGHVSIGNVASASLAFTVKNSGLKSLNYLAITMDGYNASDFSVGALGATTLAMGASTTFTVTFMRGGEGPRTAALHLVSDDPDENPFDIDLQAGTGTAQEFWRQKYFRNPHNSGKGADLADFDKDGIFNLIEYAFGLDPKRDSSGGLPQVQLIGGNLVYRFLAPPDVSGITYGAEWSSTLQPGPWTPVLDTGVFPEHLFSVPTSGKPRVLMRLKISSP